METKLIGEICLYGNRGTGAGYIARTADGKLFGNGDPLAGHSMTEALWRATEEIKRSGYRSGNVQVFAAGGRMMAFVPIDNIPYFGDLDWKSAPVIEISMEEVMRAAEKP